MIKSSHLPRLVVIAVVLTALQSVAAQQAAPVPQPPRDVVRRDPAGATGTGVIKGRVVAADTGNPIRKANINLAPAAPPAPPGGGPPTNVTTTMIPGSAGSSAPQAAAMLTRPRQGMSDSQGGFEFSGLPAGSYRIYVSPNQYAPQYLGMAYGAKRPNGPGSSDQGQVIQLAEGQSFDKAIIALPRGAIITGRVTDENGEPQVRVQVYTLFFPAGSSRGMRMGSANQTDDLGQFRIYGLQAGEHAVAAEAMRFNFAPPNAPPETEEERIGFVTTYYPGTPDEGAAQRVRARLGTETSGIEIRLAQSRLFHVSGAVVDSQGKPLALINGQLMRRSSTISSGFSNVGFSTDDKGQFQMRNVAAGNYRLIVRQTRPFTPGPQPADPGEMASLPLTIAGADLDNVMVMTTPGGTITGQLVFEQGPPAALPRQMRVIATVGNFDEMSGLQAPQPALVKPDLTFTMKGFVGEYLLRTAIQDVYLKSVTAGGEDITDTPREFKSTDRVTITVTSRASTVEGNVIDAAGGAATESGIILFSEDKSLWFFNSTRTKRTAVDQNGHFRIPGLMPGRYFIAAIPRDRLSVPPGADTALFEELSKEATSLVLGEDEQRRIDLKIPTGGR